MTTRRALGSRQLATSFMAVPGEWCSQCAAIVKAKEHR